MLTVAIGTLGVCILGVGVALLVLDKDRQAIRRLLFNGWGLLSNWSSGKKRSIKLRFQSQECLKGRIKDLRNKKEVADIRSVGRPEDPSWWGQLTSDEEEELRQKQAELDRRGEKELE